MAIVENTQYTTLCGTSHTVHEFHKYFIQILCDRKWYHCEKNDQFERNIFLEKILTGKWQTHILVIVLHRASYKGNDPHLVVLPLSVL